MASGTRAPCGAPDRMATAHEFPARFADDPHSAEGLPVPAAEANTPAAVPGAAPSSALRSGRTLSERPDDRLHQWL